MLHPERRQTTEFCTQYTARSPHCALKHCPLVSPACRKRESKLCREKQPVSSLKNTVTCGCWEKAAFCVPCIVCCVHCDLQSPNCSLPICSSRDRGQCRGENCQCPVGKLHISGWLSRGLVNIRQYLLSLCLSWKNSQVFNVIHTVFIQKFWYSRDVYYLFFCESTLCTAAAEVEVFSVFFHISKVKYLGSFRPATINGNFFLPFSRSLRKS